MDVPLHPSRDGAFQATNHHVVVIESCEVYGVSVFLRCEVVDLDFGDKLLQGRKVQITAPGSVDLTGSSFGALAAVDRLLWFRMLILYRLRLRLFFLREKQIWSACF